MDTPSPLLPQTIRLAAARLFCRKGYAETSMSDVAGSLGLRQEEVERYYATKNKLLGEICLGMAELFLLTFDQAQHRDAPPAVRLKQLFSAYGKVMVHNTSAAEVYFRDWEYLEEPARSELKTMQDEQERLFYSLLEQGMKEHVFMQMNKRLATLTVIGSLSALSELLKDSPPEDYAAVADEVSSMLLHGLKAPSV